MIWICCCCYLHLIIMGDFKMTSFNQATIFTFPTLQAVGDSRFFFFFFFASLNPLTVCFHTKLIKDSLNREHTMRERNNSRFSVFLQKSTKYIVYSATSTFPTSENFRDNITSPTQGFSHKQMTATDEILFSNIVQLFKITKVLHSIKSDFLSRRNVGESPRGGERGKLLFHHIPFLLTQLDICDKLSLHRRSVNFY